MLQIYSVAAILVSVVVSQDGCKSPAVIIGPSGQLSSPYYNFYPDHAFSTPLQCRWMIFAPAGDNVEFTWTSPFNLGGGFIDICPTGNQLTFYTAERAGEEVCSTGSKHVKLGPICGDRVPPSFVLIGHQFVIEYCTSSSQNSRGFQLAFRQTDKKPSPEPIVDSKCRNQTLYLTDANNYQVTVSSPNYPSSYPASSDCDWTIVGPESSGIEVTASSDFELENCHYDYLELSDPGANVVLGTFCLKQGPQPVKTLTNTLHMRFHSDFSVQHKGFRLTIKQTRCRYMESSCANDPSEQTCLSDAKMCDGRIDCPEALDENCPLGCGTPAIKPFLFARSTRSVENKIVGGIEARPHSWPWQVSTGIRSFGSYRHSCAGSILDHHWVLTAAHCCEVSGLSPWQTFGIQVGEHDLSQDVEKYALFYELEKIVKHPKWQMAGILYDFCLLKTTKPILLSTDVHPVCLHSARNVTAGQDCFITGWGDMGNFVRHDDDRVLANKLRQAHVKIVDQEKCRQMYTASNGTQIAEPMICAQEAERGSCGSDSGGPLVCRAPADPDRWEVVGVTSWGNGCANPDFPTVYARTSSALPWITETIFKQ